VENKTVILTVEDNEPDSQLLKKALENINNSQLEIINLINGQDALDFIYKIGDYSDSPTPAIIILDLDLPQVDGYQVLENLKNHQIHKIIPIIIFSTSEDAYDIKTCYQMNANSYVTKSFNIKELFEKIANLGEYWLKTTQLPT